jgi:hypothetical protein
MVRPNADYEAASGVIMVVALRRDRSVAEIFGGLGIDFDRSWYTRELLRRFSYMLETPDQIQLLGNLVATGRFQIPPGAELTHRVVLFHLYFGPQCGLVSDQAEALMAHLVFGDAANRVQVIDPIDSVVGSAGHGGP